VREKRVPLFATTVVFLRLMSSTNSAVQIVLRLVERIDGCGEILSWDCGPRA
jgi:hypothetical protein